MNAFQRLRWYSYLAICILVSFIVVSCGSASQQQSNIKPNTSLNTNTPISSDNLTLNAPHLDIHSESYHHMIARINPGVFVDTNSEALKSNPQAQGDIDFAPPLRQLFVGSSRVQMKLLIISAVGNANTADSVDPSLDGIRYFANEYGIPYDVMIATTENLTEAKLVAANGDGKYQGIILTDIGLLYNNAGVFESAFTTEEWNLLWQYEREFNVRQLVMSGFPGTFPEDYGLINAIGVASTTANPLIAKTTTAGASIFKSLKTNANIPVKGAFTYLADICTGATCPAVTTTPILTDQATGRTIGTTTITTDGREVLNLNMNHNLFLEHTGIMSYDLLTWLTQGTFIGERRYYLNMDVDDWYQESALWDPVANQDFSFDVTSFRLEASDVYAARDGVLDLRSRFNVPNLIYNQVFNGNGADPNAVLSCAPNATLSEASLCVGDFFSWVNHTFTHADVDFLSYTEVRKELEDNIILAEANPELDFSRKFAVTGRHSGLGWYAIALSNGTPCVVDQVPTDAFCQFGLEASSTNMLQAAVDLGIEYLAANRGWNTHVAACDTCLIVHPLEPRVKLVPRWPTSIFYNTSNPTENADEFNYLFGPEGIVRDGFGNPFFTVEQTWAQVLAFDSGITIRHLLSGSPYPHFFHQNNLREYAPGRSLLYDWTEAALEIYDGYFNIPVISQDWEGITQTLEARTSFFNAGASGVWDRATNAVSITSSNGGTVFVTGANFDSGQRFNYGSAAVSQLAMSAGQTITNATATPPTNNNVLVNGGFESNLTAWTACSTGQNAIVTTGAFEGARALNLRAVNGQSACIYQEATATPGKTYTLTCQAKRNSNAVYSSIQLSFSNADYSQELAVKSSAVTGAAYSAYTFTTVAPANAAHVAVGFYSEDDVTFDACVLTDGGTTPPPPPTNTAPTLAAIAAQSNQQGIAVNVTVSAQDANGDTLSFSATGLPAGVAISSSTGAMTGSPTNNGSNNVTVTVSDGSLSASRSFVWTISATPPPPPPTNSNLLANPNFESGLASWDLVGCGSGSITTSTDANSGTQAMLLSVSEICVGQSVAISGAGTYTLSCDVKNVGGGYADISFYAGDTLLDFAELTGNSYNRVSISGVAAASATDISSYIYMDSGSVLIDNCSLIKQ